MLQFNALSLQGDPSKCIFYLISALSTLNGVNFYSLHFFAGD